MLSIGRKYASRSVGLQARALSSSTPSASSPSSSTKPDAGYLNPDRKRKLISLYHRTKSFITKETLSNHIDREFGTLKTQLLRQELDIDDINRVMDEQHNAPRMTVITNDMTRRPYKNQVTYSWSSVEDRRANALNAALYGLDESLKPGLEVVEDYARRRPVEETTSPTADAEKLERNK